GVTFFFFQAEDGIRDFHVTGVRTCALPISGWSSLPEQAALNNRLSPAQAASHGRHFTGAGAPAALGDAWRAGRAERSEAERVTRSEERRVGNECRARWPPQ